MNTSVEADVHRALQNTTKTKHYRANKQITTTIIIIMIIIKRKLNNRKTQQTLTATTAPTLNY